MGRKIRQENAALHQRIRLLLRRKASLEKRITGVKGQIKRAKRQVALQTLGS